MSATGTQQQVMSQALTQVSHRRTELVNALQKHGIQADPSDTLEHLIELIGDIGKPKPPVVEEWSPNPDWVEMPDMPQSGEQKLYALAMVWPDYPWYALAANAFDPNLPPGYDISADSPTYWWKFNDAPGSATAQEAENANNITSLNGVTLGQPGLPGDSNNTAASFSGAPTQIAPTSLSIPTPGPQPPFSIEAWFKTTSTVNSVLISFVSTQSGAYTTNYDRSLTVYSNGQVYFKVGGTSMGNYTYCSDGEWHHVVATIDSFNRAFLYVDGTLATVTTYNFSAGFTSTAGYWRIGNSPTGTANFNGELAHVAVYNGKVLSQASISAHYDAGMSLGSYQVDWGDGTVEQHTSGKAEHQYNFDSLPSTVTSDGYKTVLVTLTPGNQDQQILSVDVSQLPTSDKGTGKYTQLLWFRANLPYVTQITLTSSIARSCLMECFELGENAIKSFSGFLSGCAFLKKADVDTRHGTNFASMFQSCVVLEEVAVSDVSNGTTFNSMFYNCRLLKVFPPLDTSNGTDFGYMFSNCTIMMTAPPLDTSNAVSVNGMFYYAEALKEVPLYDTSKVTNFAQMFGGCYILESVPLFDTSQGTNFNSMFYGAYSLEKVPLFDLGNATNVGSMFYNCYPLKEIPPFNTSKVTDFDYFLGYCDVLKTIPPLDTSQAIYLNGMFYCCYSLRAIPPMNTSKCVNATYMFYNCVALTEIPPIDTSQCTDISYMFAYCSALRYVPSLSTGNVTNLAATFQGCYALVEPPILSDTSKVTNFSYMFTNCQALVKHPVMNTIAGTNFSYMFQNCFSLLAVNLNTSNGTNFYAMFAGASSITRVDLDTGKTTNMQYMFQYATALQEVSVTDKIAAASKSNMFQGCFALQSVNLIMSTATGPLIFTSTGLTHDGLVALFNQLPSRVGLAAQSVTYTGTPAVGTLSAADKAIATGKNWTLVPA